MIRYTARVVLYDRGPFRGPLPSPTRSFVLGDPATGDPVVGCEIDLLGHDQFVPGLSAEATIDVVSSDVGRQLPGSVPIWYGGVIGETHELALVVP
jgi:hypothetical protein